MISRSGARLGGYSVVAIVLLAIGFGFSWFVPRNSATPQVMHGIVRLVRPDGAVVLFQANGSSQVLSYSILGAFWRDSAGTWHDSGSPSCLPASSHGAHISIGLITANPSGAIPALPIVVWVSCAG